MRHPNTHDNPLPAQEVAQEKMDNLLQGKCDAYGVRMVSLDEYKTYFEDDPRFGNAYGECAFVQGYPFQKLLQENAHERADVASEYFDANADAHRSLRLHPHLLQLLHKAHSLVQRNISESAEELRAQTLRQFHDLFIEDQSARSHQWQVHIGDVRVEPMACPLAPDEEEDRFRGKCFNPPLDKDTVALIEKFSSNPEKLSKDEFRNLLRTLSSKIQGYRQYQLEVVFDRDCLKRPIVGGFVSDDDVGWVELRRGSERGILATIVCIPDRSLVEEVVALASSNPELAHPVFDAQGNCVYPRKNTEGVSRSMG